MSVIDLDAIAMRVELSCTDGAAAGIVEMTPVERDALVAAVRALQEVDRWILSRGALPEGFEHIDRPAEQARAALAPFGRVRIDTPGGT